MKTSRLAGCIGLEIDGIDLKESLASERDRAQLEALLIRH